MTRKELEEKLAALGKISDEKKRSIVCALLGHSKIITMCFGYVNCARCGDQIGDTLSGRFNLSKHVIIGHQERGGICRGCLDNYNKLSWKDKIHLPEKEQEELLAGLGLAISKKKAG